MEEGTIWNLKSDSQMLNIFLQNNSKLISKNQEARYMSMSIYLSGIII